jgi:hypothetical protein
MEQEDFREEMEELLKPSDRPKRAPLDWEAIGTWFWGLVFIAVGVYVFWLGPDVLWYAVEYKVSPDKVYIAPKPTDCDFLHAPMGLKDCHYERIVAAQLHEGSGNADIRFRRADEKDWHVLPGETDRNAQYDSVYVSWIKKSD